MSKKQKNKRTFLYEDLIGDLSTQIANGTLSPGNKLPGVRKLSKQLNISINTIIHSYNQLEYLGLIESKPQSGFYVKNKIGKPMPEPETFTLQTAIKTYKRDELIFNVHELASINEVVSFGTGVPSLDILPYKKLKRIISSIGKSSPDGGLSYEFPPGNYNLRTEIAKRTLKWGGNISPNDIIITEGGIDGLVHSIKAVARKGDTLITESPTFYLIFQIAKDLGINILEVPTHPKEGIEIDSLKRILKQHKVAACITYPTINNPLGSVMPEEKREELYTTLTERNIPIIEGDVWGELCFHSKRPKSLKSIDAEGNVIYFSSFTKTGLPGYRVGWVCPGKFYKKIKEQKYIYSIANSTIPQIIVSEFLKTEAYEKNIENLKKTYSLRLSILYNYISEYFPNGTKVAKPQGGGFLWIELPKSVDSIKLHDLAISKNIIINPGPLFSATDNFSNFIRLSCVGNWVPNTIESSIKTLGELCRFTM